MSGPSRKPPKAATVEDCDEDTDSPLPGSRACANVAAKRATSSQPDISSYPLKDSHVGGDSGYSSKAATIASMTSNRRKPSELKVDTGVVERERKPYLYSATTPSNEPSTFEIRKEKDVRHEMPPKKSSFVHPKGKCWTCDKYGYHVKAEDVPPSDVAAPSLSSKVVRATASKTRDEDSIRPNIRRSSSTRERPQTWYAPSHMQTAPSPQYVYSMMMPQVIGTPITPSMPHNAYTYTYSIPNTPLSPHTPAAAPYAPWSYIEEPQRPPPQRRLSSRAREEPLYEQKPTKATRDIEKSTSRDRKPAVVSQRKSKEVDDRIAMPPPPRPNADVITTNRPTAERARTYHSGSARRSSQIEVVDESPELQGSYAAKDSRPPTSYRGPSKSESADRPPGPGKSRSYTNDSTTSEVAAALRKQLISQRTMTGSVPHEQKEAEAEAYQRRQGSIAADDLTTENLKRYASHTGGHRSEAGSTASRRSHYSSSKDSSSGRGRGTSLTMSRSSKTHINVNGVSVSIPEGYDESQTPVKIDLGSITISMGAKDKETFETTKEMKRIERAPSTASKTSRRSIVSASSAPRKNSDEVYYREVNGTSSRRSSNNDDHGREAARSSAKSSRQHSRAGSSVRGSFDYGRRDNNAVRSSQDYGRDEPMIYGA